MSLVDKEKFKTARNGRAILLRILKDLSGMAVKITHFNAFLVSIIA